MNVGLLGGGGTQIQRSGKIAQVVHQFHGKKITIVALFCREEDDDGHGEVVVEEEEEVEEDFRNRLGISRGSKMIVWIIFYSNTVL